MQSLVVLLEDVTEPEREALVRWGAKAGADVLTGEGWALVSAAASRLAPLARPDRLPPGLERLAPELGRFLASYADPPRRWEIVWRRPSGWWRRGASCWTSAASRRGPARRPWPAPRKSGGWRR